MTTYNNEMLAHIWAQQNEKDGKNSTNSFYFNGPTIYSYGSHFPIASFVKPNVILFTIDRCSNTTDKHISLTRRGIPDNYNVYNVPNVEFAKRNGDKFNKKSHIENLDYLKEKALDCISKASRARTYKSMWLENAQKNEQAYNNYKKEFRIKRIDFELPDIGQHIEAAKLEKLKAKKREQKKKRETIKTAYERIKKWINGEPVNIVGLSNSIDTMLRIKPSDTETVETSRGAEFPVTHAVMAYRFIKRIKERGQTWKANGHVVHLGHFKIDVIDSAGNVKAGCHLVKWGQIKKMGEYLLNCESTTRRNET